MHRCNALDTTQKKLFCTLVAYIISSRVSPKFLELPRHGYSRGDPNFSKKLRRIHYDGTFISRTWLQLNYVRDYPCSWKSWQCCMSWSVQRTFNRMFAGVVSHAYPNCWSCGQQSYSLTAFRYLAAALLLHSPCFVYWRLSKKHTTWKFETCVPSELSRARKFQTKHVKFSVEYTHTHTHIQTHKWNQHRTFLCLINTLEGKSSQRYQQYRESEM